MKYLSLIFMLFLTGCATSTITGKTYPPVPESEVRIWFASGPDCDIEEIGFLSVPYAIGQSMLASALKKEGAAIGAQHVLVSAVNANKNYEYSGGAIAARCR
jgi:hypothetical protein